MLKLLSARKYHKEHFYDLVYEWENLLSQKMPALLLCLSGIFYMRFFRCVPLLKSFLTTDLSVVFEMTPELKHHIFNKNNIVPIIIDWYIWKPSDLVLFQKQYKNNRGVIVTSCQVYDFLVNSKIVNTSRYNVKHLALSISDKYEICATTKFSKIYDVIAIGRQNRVLSDYMRRYCASHSNINYIYRTKIDNKIIYVSTKEGIIGQLNSRAELFDIMCKTKVALYSTAGMDEEYQELYHGFHQVTPRFLEYLASGCHVISRFEDNSDTVYFQLEEMSYRVNSYEEFERTLTALLSKEVDLQTYSQYLEKHYTSVRAAELRQILQTLQEQ